jgi:peroxiredoxin
VVSINQQESTESILAFMKHEGVRVPVALDKESEVAGLYQVAGVPQIVIIDKSGVVRDVYMGYGKTLEDDLRVILNTLAASTPAVK